MYEPDMRIHTTLTILSSGPVNKLHWTLDPMKQSKLKDCACLNTSMRTRTNTQTKETHLDKPNTARYQTWTFQNSEWYHSYQTQHSLAHSTHETSPIYLAPTCSPAWRTLSSGMWWMARSGRITLRVRNDRSHAMSTSLTRGDMMHTSTTKQSMQFHMSRKYECGPRNSPKATI